MNITKEQAEIIAAESPSFVRMMIDEISGSKKEDTVYSKVMEILENKNFSIFKKVVELRRNFTVEEMLRAFPDGGFYYGSANRISIRSLKNFVKEWEAANVESEKEQADLIEESVAKKSIRDQIFSIIQENKKIDAIRAIRNSFNSLELTYEFPEDFGDYTSPSLHKTKLFVEKWGDARHKKEHTNVYSKICDIIEKKDKVGAIKEIRELFDNITLFSQFPGDFKLSQFGALHGKPDLKETKLFVENMRNSMGL